MVRLLVSLIIAILLQNTEAEKPQQNWDTPRQGSNTEIQVFKRGHDLTTADIEQGRDLSQYKDGGSIDRPRYEQPNFSQIRQFIWSCWQHKRRGYIRYSDCSVDSCSTSHFFIEPRADGVWRIAWRIAYGSNRVTDFPDIVSVAWEKRQKGDQS